MGSLKHCRVSGDSMYPTLKEGDLIIYKPFKTFDNELSEGLLVVVAHPLRKKTLIVKRISKIYSETIEILGDNESRSIDSRQFGQIHTNQLQGIVETIIPI